MLWMGRPERFWTTDSNEKNILCRVGGEVGGLDKGDRVHDGSAGSEDDATCDAVGFVKRRVKLKTDRWMCKASHWHVWQKRLWHPKTINRKQTINPKSKKQHKNKRKRANRFSRSYRARVLHARLSLSPLAAPHPGLRQSLGPSLSLQSPPCRTKRARASYRHQSPWNKHFV